MGTDKKDKVVEYLNQTKWIILATVDDNQTPVLRTLGSFAVDGFNVYFSTGNNTAKVNQIELNPKVSVFFQHENQELPSYINVSVTGKANKVTTEEELNKVITLLSNRNPKFKERVEKGEIGNSVFYRVAPKEVKLLDFSKGKGPEAVEVITAGCCCG